MKKEKIKFYDKDIETIKNSLVDAITIIAVFLISFWVGYIAGINEGTKEGASEEMSNMPMVSMYENEL